MNAKKAKKIRRLARTLTAGQPKKFLCVDGTTLHHDKNTTRHNYQLLKKGYTNGK